MRKKLLTRTALAATIALGIGSFNLAYAAETEDTSSGKKINVMASFYPMYDFAHPIEDAVEGITHSICTLEFEDHRPLYDLSLIHISEPTRH